MRKMFIVVIICVITAIMVGCGQESTATNGVVDLYKSKAQEYIDAGDLDTAILALQEGIEATKDPSLSEMLSQVKAKQTPAPTIEPTPKPTSTVKPTAAPKPTPKPSPTLKPTSTPSPSPSNAAWKAEYLNIVDNLTYSYGYPAQAGVYNGMTTYSGMCGGFLVDLGGDSTPELIIAFSPVINGMPNSVIQIYTYNNSGAQLVGEYNVLAAANGRSWNTYAIYQDSGGTCFEIQTESLPEMGPNGFVAGPASKVYYCLYDATLVGVNPSILAQNVHETLLGQYDYILFQNYDELRSQLAQSGTAVPAVAPVPTMPPRPTATPSPTVASSRYLLPDSDRRYMTEADLSPLSWERLCLARNEIYARHGRIFITKAISDYFESQDWYSGTIPGAQFSESVLNAYESANVNFIMQYEIANFGSTYYYK